MGTPGGGASSSSGGDDGGSDASPSGEGSSSSSVPLAAIVAPIAAVAAASLAALAFVLLQRSRQQGQALGKAPGSLQGGSGTGFKPDIAFPPSELAFHEVRYACTARPALDVLCSGFASSPSTDPGPCHQRSCSGLANDTCTCTSASACPATAPFLLPAAQPCFEIRGCH